MAHVIVPYGFETLTDTELAAFAPNVHVNHIQRLRSTLANRKQEIIGLINAFVEEMEANNEAIDYDDPTGFRKKHAYEIHNFALLDGGQDVSPSETVRFQGISPLGPQPEVTACVFF